MDIFCCQGNPFYSYFKSSIHKSVIFNRKLMKKGLLSFIVDDKNKTFENVKYHVILGGVFVQTIITLILSVINTPPP